MSSVFMSGTSTVRPRASSDSEAPCARPQPRRLHHCAALFKPRGEWGKSCAPAPCRYGVFRLTAGWCAVATTRRGICGLVLPSTRARDAAAALRTVRPDALPGWKVPRGLVRRLEDYFSGRSCDLARFGLDLSCGTRFQRRVWNVVRTVPCGETRTYIWLARRLGNARAARAVGNALAANPVPLLVPCHRIVRSDGGLGGFSPTRSDAMKAMLLAIEQRICSGEGGCRRQTGLPVRRLSP